MLERSIKGLSVVDQQCGEFLMGFHGYESDTPDIRTGFLRHGFPPKTALLHELISLDGNRTLVCRRLIIMHRSRVFSTTLPGVMGT